MGDEEAMEGLIRKHFWVVWVLGTVAIAWAAASAANEFLASKVLVAPRVTLAVPHASASLDDILPKRLRDAALADELASRHPFNSEPPKEEEPVEEANNDQEDKEPAETHDEGGIEESDLDVQLVGTLVYPDPSMSLATVVDGGESKLARIGSTVDGGAKVIAIARRYIVVEEEGGKRSYIRLWSKKKPKQGSRLASLRSPGRVKPFGGFRRPTDHTPRRNRTNWAAGITKVGPDEYEIKRSLLDEQLQDLGKLGTQARIIPNYRNGRYEGFKLVGVRPNSLYRAIGIRSGDVIKRVNGVAIDNPSKAIELFEQFRTASEISLDIERRGKVKTFTYKIR